MLLELGLIAVVGMIGKTFYGKKVEETPDDSAEPSDPPGSARAAGRREQQLREISATAGGPAVSVLEKQADRYLAVSSLALAMSAVGYLAFPPLVLLSVPVTLYSYLPFTKDAYNDLKRFFTEKPRITMGIVDTVIMAAMLATRSFFSCALITAFLWLSQKLLVKAEDHAQKSLINVFSEQPRSVWLFHEGVEVEIPFEEIKLGDVLVVHAGEPVPADGKIVRGNASIDQRILTGEAQPAEKGRGDTVFASTVVLSGSVHVEVEKAGQDTVAAQIGAMLNRTSDYAKDLEWQWKKFVDSLSPLTLAAGAVTWPLLGSTAAVGMLMSVNFGYAMRIIAPLTLLNFLNLSSKDGILVKDGRVLERLKQIDTVVLDKTGTLTQEIPTVGNIYPADGQDVAVLLAYAAAAEYRQTHPVALALLEEAKARRLEVPQISDAHYEVGYGIKVKLGGKTIHVGSPRYMAMEAIGTPADLATIRQQCLVDGNTLICVAVDRRLAGMIELVPTIRPEAWAVVAELKQRGLGVSIISGDHERATQRLAHELGIEHYFAETLPENKSSLIEQIQKEGKTVCFVGDGINDSLALKTANVSVSLRGASSVAKDTASIVLMDENLNQLVRLLDTANDLDKNMKNSFILSTIPTVTSIGGVLILHLHIVGTIILYFTGLGLGVGNAVLPLLKQERRPLPLPAIDTQAEEACR